MIFKHEKFQLDQSEQIVYDSKGNELRIFGNEYLMLEQLCEKKSVLFKELAILLGLGELYNGKVMDEYMARINAHLQSEVIKRENGDYFIVGELTTIDKIEKANAPSRVAEFEGGEEHHSKKSKFQVSWQLVIVFGVGMLVGIWLIKYILDMLL